MLLRRPRLMVSALAVALGLSAIGFEGAHATSVVLCTGTQTCADEGMGDAGYAAERDQMHWMMYAGHNCTNYAAYRMIAAGMSPTRPWTGSGMASNWGVANAALTDQNPTVSSIAWWSSGHVAYVERVNSATQIVISEDSWSGKQFDWRQVDKGGGSWPTGFIHFLPGDPVTPPPATDPGAPASTVTYDLVQKPRRHVVRLQVGVQPADPAAAGRDTPTTGQVKVRVGRQRQVVDLLDGQARLKFTGVYRGRHSFAVTYLGSPTLARAKVRNSMYMASR